MVNFKLARFACADIGASVTRWMSDSTNKINEIPNNMLFVGLEEHIDLPPTTDDILDALDVTIEKVEASEHFPCRVLIGTMAERRSPINVAPMGNTNKMLQRVNHVSTILSAALSIIDTATSMSTAPIQIPFSLALPPTEVKSSKDSIVEELKGTYRVIFNKLDKKEVNFQLSHIGIYAESFLASLSFLFSIDGKRKVLFEKYATGNLLSLDIGASTTDPTLIKNRVYQETTGTTFKVGGNMVRTSFIQAVMANYNGYDIPESDADAAIQEGRMIYGNSYEDVSELVANAKRLYAQEIVNRLYYYLNSISVPIQTLRAILVSGGGSMCSSYENEKGETIVTVPSMTHYIAEALKEICKTVDVIEYDENPRTANIKGLYLRAKADLRKMQGDPQATN